MSLRNIENIRQLTTRHTSGSLSYASRYEEMKEQSVTQGRASDLIDLYDVVHQKADGTYVSEESRRVVEHMRKVRQEQVTTQKEGEEIDPLLPYRRTIGQKEHPGRVRGMGFGVTLTRLYGRGGGGEGSSQGRRRRSDMDPAELRRVEESMQSFRQEVEARERAIAERERAMIERQKEQELEWARERERQRQEWQQEREEYAERERQRQHAYEMQMARILSLEQQILANRGGRPIYEGSGSSAATPDDEAQLPAPQRALTLGRPSSRPPAPLLGRPPVRPTDVRFSQAARRHTSRDANPNNVDGEGEQ